MHLKKVAFLMSLLLVAPVSAMETKPSESSVRGFFEDSFVKARSHWAYDFGLLGGSSLFTAGVIGLYHWAQNRKNSEGQISEEQVVIHSKQIIEIIEKLSDSYPNFLHIEKVTDIVKNNDFSTEIKASFIFTGKLAFGLDYTIKELLNNMKKLIDLQGKLVLFQSIHKKKNEKCSELDEIIKKTISITGDIKNFMIFIDKHEHYFYQAKQVSEALLLKDQVGSAELLQALKNLEVKTISQSEFPEMCGRIETTKQNLRKAYDQALLRERIEREQVELRERTKKAQLNLTKIQQELKAFERELHSPLSFEAIKQSVYQHQVGSYSKYGYLYYAQALHGAMQRIEIAVEEIKTTGIAIESSLLAEVQKLKNTQQFIHGNAQFMRFYNEEVETKRRDDLETERVETLKRQVQQEERARQEQLDLERKRVRLLDDQVRVEKEKVQEIKRQATLEEQRKKACQESAKEERRRREAELQKAKAIEEQNRIEREKLARKKEKARQKQQEYKPQLNPAPPSLYPNPYAPSAPPMD